MRHALIGSLCFLILAVATYTGAVTGCGGAADNGGGVVSVNDLDGATDVAVDSVFKYTFSQFVDTATVTNDTFFMVEDDEPVADITRASFEPSKCDNTQAIDAIISCLTTTECTLDPTANLGSYRRYFVCLSPDINYLNGDPFEGFMATFTTADGAGASYTVGGSLSGLDDGEQVILQNNGTDDLTCTQNGGFVFEAEVSDGDSYAVTVLEDPAIKTCTASNNTGTVSGADVTDVSVVCSVDTYTVGGTVSGLDPGDELGLQNNGTDDLTVTDNGEFTFSTPVADGAGYEVTVSVSPNQKSCTVSNGSGTISSADVTDVSVDCTTPQPPQWAESVTSGDTLSVFDDVGSDSDGNAYAAGHFDGGEHGFGNGVTVTGAYTDNNVVLVKYNSNGLAQWAKSTTVGPGESMYYGVYVTPDGNAHAVGYVTGTGEYGFGNDVTVSNGHGFLIVKYNTDGDAQWANTASEGGGYFYDVAVDGSGNAYAVGRISGSGTCNFGNGVTVSGTSTGYNLVIVKYNSAGVAQWAKSVSGSGDHASYFEGITIDGDGNAYAVGKMYGTNVFDFGNGKTVSAAYSGYNLLIVKYNSTGDAQWAKSVVAGSRESLYRSVAYHSDDYVYAVGDIAGTGEYNIGNGQTVSGGSNEPSVIIAKYNLDGDAQWAKSVVGNDRAQYHGVNIGPDGYIYAVGLITETDLYNFGNGIAVKGAYSSDVYAANNCVIVKYNTSGTAQWAKSVFVAPHYTQYYGVSISPDNDVYAVGVINRLGVYDFGNSVTASGTHEGGASGGRNVVIVKY